MRFIDEAVISITAGHGGPGCVSFRREKYIPRGGPDGGDGGEGASIKFVATSQKATLQDFRFKRKYDAPNGMHGAGANKAGRDGVELVIPVPVGTIIRDVDTGDILVDFVDENQEWLAACGGRGGKGNAHFVTSTFQAPRFAQDGEEGEFKDLKLELKLLADAAIIGFPNAGKSTFISRISAARPKIADYPFTTLTPNLGVVALPDMESFVIADIPGLIENAHKGYGLGHKFLKHIERNRIFVHLLDGTQMLEDATKPGDDSFDKAIDELVRRYTIIRNELGLFNPELLEKPEIVALNKLDLLESDPELVARAREALRKRIGELRTHHGLTSAEPYVVSAVSGTGMKELMGAVSSFVIRNRAADREQALNEGRNVPDVLPPDYASLREWK